MEWHSWCQNGQGARTIILLRQSFPSARMSGPRNKEKQSNAHLHMSLLELPLHLVLIPSVEIGLDSDG